MSKIMVDANMVEQAIDEILSRGFKDMDYMIQEHLMEKLEEAQEAFNCQQFDRTMQLLYHCNNVGKYRNFQIPNKEGVA